MKKLLAILLAAMMLLSLVACGGNTETETNAPETNAPETNAPETNAPETDAPETDAPAAELAYKSAQELLSLLLNGYNNAASDDAKLYLGGGNIYNFETVSMDGPAKFVALEDEDYNANLGYPAADAAKIDDAASMFHMQNVNVFTGYAVHFANSGDVDAMVETLKANISARRWDCGHPEKLYIVKVPGDYLVVVWGVVTFGGVAHSFAEQIPSLVEGSTIVVDLPLV